MIRTKTLSLTFASALLATAVVPVHADVAMQLSTRKSYRQNKFGDTLFRGGSFDVAVRDGNGIVVGGCARPFYWPPNIPGDPCPGGSTAYVLFGDPTGNNAGPYFWMTDVIPAIIIEPRRPELCILRAAPPSDLPRPYSGFKDTSFGVYYNLHEAAAVREYIISRYDTSRTYSEKQLKKFEGEIVPGVYHYEFPRLNDPQVKLSISPVIYPMPEGFAEKNNQKVGVRFQTTRWSKKGFMELSYVKPNVIRWTGFSPTTTYATVDKLYFSMRFLKNDKNPQSDVSYINPITGEGPASFFPPYVSGGDPRVLLANPFVDHFTLPPVFKGGSTAVIELELDRSFQTGGVTFDFSTRKFQIPVVIVNRYSEYAELRFKKNTKLVGILDDFDGDGYNNLNEWILDSRADDSASIPQEPVPSSHAAEFYPLFIPQYYGFTVEKKRGTVPRVNYTLQRSTNNGRTWKEFVSDANWTVTETPEEFKVESAITNGFDPFTGFPLQVEPPGTADHRYRVKITLAK